MTDSREIERLLNRLFTKYGAKKKGRNWLLESPETVCHVKLEANRWRKHEYALPFWVFVRELWKGPALAEPLWNAPKWHIFGSRYSTDLEQSVELERYLNLRQEVGSTEVRAEHLERRCNEIVIPFLLEMRTVDGIRRAKREGLLHGKAVHRDLQNFLAIFGD